MRSIGGTVESHSDCDILHSHSIKMRFAKYHRLLLFLVFFFMRDEENNLHRHNL